MEDVDEGFGSNNSNHTCSNANKEASTMLNYLKFLNGKVVIDKDTNGDKLCNGTSLENNKNKLEVKRDDVQKDIENDLAIVKSTDVSENSRCVDFSNVLRMQHNEKSMDHDNSSESNEMTVTTKTCEADSASVAHEDKKSCSSHVIKHDEAIEVCNDKSVSFDSGTKTALESIVDENEQIVQTENKLQCVNNKDIQENELVCMEEGIYSKENCTDKLILNDIGSEEINSLKMAAVKRPTSSADCERSPFLLDDKIRKSLKGLVAKVKSSELSRDSTSPVDSLVSGGDSPAQAKLFDIDLESIDDKPKEQERQTDADQQELETDNGVIDEDILEDKDEDGISMEIGSENEDNLLEFDSDEANDDKCSIEDGADEESNTMVTDPSLEDTTSSITVEISSDNEDDVDDQEDLGENGCGIKKQDFEDKIQFEEDSNSNGDSGKINDIVNFLNRDLSGTNSPLTTNDVSEKEYSKSNNVENDVLMETKDTGKDARSEDVEDCVEEKNIENTETTKDENISESIVQDETHNNAENDKAACIVAKNETSEVVKEDGPSLGVMHLEPTLKTEVIKDDEPKDLKKENVIVTKDDTQEFNTCEKDEIVSKGEINDEDDDDDVIFEGETKPTMPPMRHEFKHLNPSLKADQSSSVVNCMNTDKSNITNNKTNVAEEDDDVIFEKETKAEDIKSKQNCDSLNSMGDINTTQKADLTASSPTHVDSETSNSENKTNIDTSTIPISRGTSDRKRSAEDKELGENESKRSRLDLTGLIGKLGSRVEPASIEVSDSDDEDERSMLTDTVEDKTPNVTEKNMKETSNEKMITVTEKELEELVREKVKTYLESQHDTLIAKLSQKVKDLQTNNDLWKRQVKDLQVKVNDVTVLQQKLEKRKAATAALRQITTRNVAVQVDEGRTSSAHAVLKQMLAMKLIGATEPRDDNKPNISLPPTASSKKIKVSSSPAKVTAHVPLVSAQGGNGTIRLPIPQSVIAPQVIPTHLSQGSKMMTTTYQTPSVKSLLDTTRIQKTVGSMPMTTTVATSMIGLLQYPPTYVSKPTMAPGYAQQTAPVTQVTTSVSKTTKMVTITSPNAKVIDLTDDDDISKTRLVTLQPGLNTVTNQQGVRHVLAPPGTQLVRTGLPNQPTYQLVFTSTPSGIRPGLPGMIGTMASAVPQTTSLLQAVPQSSTLVKLGSPTAVAPGTTLARAAMPAIATLPKISLLSHPAPFPTMPPNQPTAGIKGLLPPKPSLKISRVSQGIVLSWNMTLPETFSEISNYQLYAYQETSAQPVYTLWKKVGDVKALPLPMACTLTQFQVGNKYHFAVRAMDVHNRVGPFSDPGSIHLTPSTPPK